MHLRLGFVPRWLALLGYGLALLLLVGSYYIRWSFMVFPLWVLLISVFLLLSQRPERKQN
jgi:hypothetical protein